MLTTLVKDTAVGAASVPNLTRDLTRRLFNLGVDLGLHGRHDTAVFQHAGPGIYEVAIQVAKILPTPLKIDWNARVRVTFFDYETGIIRLSRVFEQPGLPWRESGKNGFTLFTYSVPEQLPFNRRIGCRVNVERPDDIASMVFGEIQLFVTYMGAGS